MIKFLLKDIFSKNIDEGYNYLIIVDINNKDITKNELLDKVQSHIDNINLCENIIEYLEEFLNCLNLNYEIINLNDLDYINY